MAKLHDDSGNISHTTIHTQKKLFILLAINMQSTPQNIREEKKIAFCR